jgi:hypothetical protein
VEVAVEPVVMRLLRIAGFCFLLVLLPWRVLAAAGQGNRHVELTLLGDVSGKGGSKAVKWYVAGPFPPECPTCPLRYVRGVEVRKAGGKFPIIAGWASRPTTITAFYPKLNALWPVSGGGAALISAAVQYGGRVLDLFMLRLKGNELKEVGHWGGENESIMRMNGRLAVEVVPDDYSQLPSLYAWSGDKFKEANGEFPSFYAKLAKAHAEIVGDPRPLAVAVIVRACKLALQAYQLAKQPPLGRDACLAARQRIASGRGIIPSPVAQPEKDFEREREEAVRAIDTLLSK